MQNLLRSFVLLSFGVAVSLARAAGPAASAADAHPLAVGAHAPGITLTDRDGVALELGAAFAAQPTVLVFYRGSWCPFCNRQLAALGELEPKLLALGYQILAVSPDRAEGLKKMAGENHLDYRLLSDHAMDASLAYGVAFRVPTEMRQAYREHGIELAPLPGGEGAWLPVPTVFIVGRDGVIKFMFSNPDYKVRLSNNALLAAAQVAAK